MDEKDEVIEFFREMFPEASDEDILVVIDMFEAYAEAVKNQENNGS